MKSWIMTVWLRNHDKSEWKDLSICQTEDACHVTDTKQHPKKEVIMTMCSEAFFGKHEYTYMDALGTKVGTSEVNGNLDSSSECQSACTSCNEVVHNVQYITSV